MKVSLINFTPHPDKVCAVAALGCHSKKAADDILQTLDDEKMKSILREVVARGHHSVIEHAAFTFAVSGVSRSLTHQLVRHRIASYSQQSQRYVELDSPTYVTPETIRKDRKSLIMFEEFMNSAWGTYRSLIRNGIPTEDARFVLPNATTTNITITMNARELNHFFALRCCLRAQWEIREMANRMLDKVRKVAPTIFEHAGPPCDCCPEPDFPCELRAEAPPEEGLVSNE